MCKNRWVFIAAGVSTVHKPKLKTCHSFRPVVFALAGSGETVAVSKSILACLVGPPLHVSGVLILQYVVLRRRWMRC